jgi:hypothetical protein
MSAIAEALTATFGDGCVKKAVMKRTPMTRIKSGEDKDSGEEVGEQGDGWEEHEGKDEYLCGDDNTGLNNFSGEG